MRELYQDIPDADVLLALQPEELGTKILLLLPKHDEMFSLAGIVHDLRQMNLSDETGYPRARLPEIERALMEAFAGWNLRC